MAWKALDRNQAVIDPDAAPALTEAVREKVRSFFDRYETKRAALLPALHVVQSTLGSISWQAMVEIADLLEIHPSDVIDTISFYTHFWTHAKGEKVITVCRSITCEILGGDAVLKELKERLGIDEHGTTEDGRYSLVTEECLAGCDHGPCLLINEKMHKRVKPGDVERILADANNDRLAFPRSTLFDAPPEPVGTDKHEQAPAAETVLETTSDVGEMREAE